MKKLIAWSQSSYHSLPWRLNRTPYRTLVSEIMLQQTTVGTVLNHFERFLHLFPDIETLASASEDQIQIAWKGLGYYRRARNLKKAAQEITERFAGKIPKDYETLISISGIGPYTASAMVAIGHDQKALAVDANLERVLSRVYLIDLPKGEKLQKGIQAAFSEGKILKQSEAVSYRALNEALMDLGRVYCQARKAHCLLCPVRPECQASKDSLWQNYPRVDHIKKEKHELELLRVVVVNRGKILGYQKREKEWLVGQIELPTFILNSTDNKLIQYPTLKKKKSFDTLPSFKTTITKYKITNRILQMSKADFDREFKKEIKAYSYYSSDDQKDNLAVSVIKALKELKKPR